MQCQINGGPACNGLVPEWPQSVVKVEHNQPRLSCGLFEDCSGLIAQSLLTLIPDSAKLVDAYLHIDLSQSSLL